MTEVKLYYFLGSYTLIIFSHYGIKVASWVSYRSYLIFAKSNISKLLIFEVCKYRAFKHIALSLRTSEIGEEISYSTLLNIDL